LRVIELLKSQTSALLPPFAILRTPLEEDPMDAQLANVVPEVSAPTRLAAIAIAASFWVRERRDLPY
jgi:hypothetical protein